MPTRLIDEMLSSTRLTLRRLVNPAESALPDGQTRDLVRETLGLFGFVALTGTLLTWALGLSANPTLTLLGIATSLVLFLLRWLALRLSDRQMAWTFFGLTLLAAVVMARTVQTVQSVHMLLLSLPLVFTTFVYGPLLGLAYGAGIGLTGVLLAHNEVLTGSAIRLDPYSQAWLLFELLVMMFLLALGLRRYVAFAHRTTSEGLARQARADGAAPIQARLEMALKAGRFGVWEYDPSSQTVTLDERALELFGLPADANRIARTQLMQQILEEDRSLVLLRWESSRHGPGPTEIRFRVQGRNGEIRWVRLDVGTAPPSAGEAIVGVLADVTDDMELASRMKAALRRADQAASAAKADFFELDLRTGRMVRDRRAEGVLGSPHEEFGRDPSNLFASATEPTRSQARAALAATLQSDATSFTFEFQIARESPGPSFFRNLSQIERDARGKPIRLYGMNMDVTESRRVRRDLERITNRFRLAAEVGNLGVWQFDLKSQLVTQTAIGVALFDLPSDQPISVQWYLERILSEDRSMVETAFRDTIAGKGDFLIVYRIKALNTIRWVRSAGRLESNERGAAVRLSGVNWDISSDIAARENLSQINNRLGLALAAANASVWEYNRATDRVTWDERANELYGIDPNLSGQRADRIIEADHPIYLAQEAVMRGDTTVDTFVVEYRIEHPVRGLRWIRCMGQINRSASPDPLTAVGIDIDVTAERTATDAIENARLVAEAANRAKSSFLANMSHEIRTPMNAIIGMTELAHRAQSLPQSTSYAGQAHAAARGLLNVLNDVLDFSKIEAGHLDLEPISFSLEEMLSPVLDVTAFGAAEKKLDFVLDIGATVRARYFGDPARIAQIMLNLTSNAIKFTDSGVIQIRVDDAGAGHLRFEVIDTGCGIAGRQQVDIFEPFSQGDRSTSRRYGGTGLGLSISRRLARLMNAELGVASPMSDGDSGATFWLEIPQPQDAADTYPTESIWDPVVTPRPEVLLMHRRPLQRDSLIRQLERLKIPWRLVEDPESLQMHLADLAANSKPVVMLDWQLMPADPGWRASIRQMPCMPRIVLLGRMLSELPWGETVLLEPTLPSELRHVLSAQEGSPVRVGRTNKLPTGSQAHSDHRPVPNTLAGVEILLAEDNELNRLLVIGLLDESGAHVRIARNGLEALEAVMQHLPDVVLMDVHMPEMDGYQATAAIRAIGPGGRNLPIIAITADALEGDYDKTLRAGMNDHLTKPIESDQLISVLQRWTVGRHAAQAVISNPTPSINTAFPDTFATSRAPGAAAPELIDVQAGIQSCMGLSKVFNKGLQVFLELYSQPDGLSGSGSLSLRDNEIANFPRLVHNLLGSVRQLGMFPLAELAASIHADLKSQANIDPKLQASLLECLLATLNQANQYLASLPAETAPTATRSAAEGWVGQG